MKRGIVRRIPRELDKEIVRIQNQLSNLNGFEIDYAQAAKVFFKKYLELKFNKRLNKKEQGIIGFKF